MGCVVWACFRHCYLLTRCHVFRSLYIMSLINRTHSYIPLQLWGCKMVPVPANTNSVFRGLWQLGFWCMNFCQQQHHYWQHAPQQHQWDIEIKSTLREVFNIQRWVSLFFYVHFNTNILKLSFIQVFSLHMPLRLWCSISCTQLVVVGYSDAGFTGINIDQRRFVCVPLQCCTIYAYLPQQIKPRFACNRYFLCHFSLLND